jgi:hypothetical protein
MYRREQPEAYYDTITAAAMETPTDVAALLLINMSGNWWSVAEKLNCPLLYVVSGDAKEQAARLKTIVPSVVVRIFADSGHALFVDESARFNGEPTKQGPKSKCPRGIKPTPTVDANIRDQEYLLRWVLVLHLVLRKLLNSVINHLLGINSGDHVVDLSEQCIVQRRCGDAVFFGRWTELGGDTCIVNLTANPSS